MKGLKLQEELEKVRKGIEGKIIVFVGTVDTGKSTQSIAKLKHSNKSRSLSIISLRPVLEKEEVKKRGNYRWSL